MKTTLNLRIESELKNKAELVTKELGITMTSAVTLFLKALIRDEGLPFDIKLAKEKKTKKESEKYNGKRSLVATKKVIKKEKKETKLDSFKDAIDYL